MEGERHFVLVHGTWALGMWRSALWRLIPEHRRPDFDWPALRRVLEESGGCVHTFVWSGQNNHKARKDAGNKLRNFLKSIAKPGVRLYVLAHSHGGNVALYALDDKTLKEHVKGIVFLATPFLHFQLQAFDLSVIRGLRGVSSFIVFMITFLILLVSTMDRLPFPDTVIVFSGLALSIGTAVLFHATIARIEQIWRPTERAAGQCRTYQPLPPDENMRVLVVRNVGDEATTALVGGQLVEMLVTIMWRATVFIAKDLIEMALERIGQSKMATMIFAVVVVAAIIVVQSLESLEDKPVMGWVLLVLLGVVIAVSAMQILLGAIVATLNLMRFGWGDPVTHALVRVSTEATPKGRWEVHLFRAEGGGAMAHSRAYQEKEIVDAIGVWIGGGRPRVPGSQNRGTGEEPPGVAP